MREIKFRAWEKPDSFSRIHGFEGKMHYDIIQYLPDWLYSKDYEVMQFTGLLDKSGIEIYEGDILKGIKWGNISVVEWLEEIRVKSDLANLDLHRDGTICVGMGYTLKPESSNRVIVIGNIYENKNLLKNERYKIQSMGKTTGNDAL